MRGLLSYIGIALVLGLLVGALSWYNSDYVYSIYAKLYYGRFRLGEAEKNLADLRAHYQKNEDAQFEILAKRLRAAYPENKKIAKLYGSYLLKQGLLVQGAALVTGSLEYNAADAESLSLLLPSLYERRLYKDLVEIVRPYDLEVLAPVPGLLFYYGASLFEIEEYDDAERVLAKGEGKSARADFYRYLALTKERKADVAIDSEQKGLLESAEFYLDTARHYAPGDGVILQDYIRVLKKLGKYEKASQVLAL